MSRDQMWAENLADWLFFQVLEKVVPEDRRGFSMGRYFFSKGQLDSAELCFDQIIREQSKYQKEVVVRALIGKSEILKQRKAFEFAQRALAMAEQLSEGEPAALKGAVRIGEAMISLARGDRRAALTQLQEAKQILAESSEPSAERVQASLLMGLVHQQLVEFHKALACYQEAADLAKDVRNAQQEVLALLGVAQVLSELGRPAAALEECERAALALDKAGGQEPNPLQVLVGEVTAGVHQLMGKLKRAKEVYEETVKRASDPKDQARLHSALALLTYDIGQPQAARDHEHRAQEIMDGLGSELPEVLLNLSSLNFSRGQVWGAEDQLFAALIAMPKDPDPRQKLNLKLRELMICGPRGKWDSANRLADELGKELSPERTPLLFLDLMNSLGWLYAARGALDKAEACYRKALTIADECGARLAAATSLRGLAGVILGRDESSPAIYLLREAIAIARECGAVVFERGLLLDLALARARVARDPGQAIPVLEEGLAESRLFESTSMEVAMLSALGSIEWGEGELDVAREHLEQAVEKAGEVGLESARITAQGLLGCLLADLGERRRAVECLEAALGAMDALGMETELKYQFQERYRDLTGFSYST